MFLLGVLVGGVGVWLVLDNNPKLVLKLKSVKKVLKDKIKGY